MDAISTSPPADGVRPQSPPDRTPSTSIAGPLWRFLLSPVALIAAAALVFLLVFALVFVPQIPDQLRDEPAAAARWYLTTAADFGTVGPFMRGVGLFDLLHSLLFRLALALLTLILAAHLADHIGNTISVRRISRHLCALPETAVGPACTSASRTVTGRRFAVDDDPVAAQNGALAWLRQRYDSVESCRTAGSAETQYRDLALRNAVSYRTRPLLPLGLLAATAFVWLYLLLGWEIQSPSLAPGTTYRPPSRDLAISYNLPPDAAEAEVAIEFAGRTITETATPNFRTRLGDSGIVVRSGEPALLVRAADGAAILIQPGEPQPTSSMGVVLPSPGSEESVLMPDLSWGLRIVRRTDDPSAFFVELYQGADLRPQQRIDVDGPATVTVEAGGQALDLQFVPLPAIDVTVRHMPGRWLLWISVVLVATGFMGVLLPPSMMLAQIGPWPEKRAVIALHGSDARDVDACTAALLPDDVILQDGIGGESQDSTAGPAAKDERDAA